MIKLSLEEIKKFANVFVDIFEQDKKVLFNNNHVEAINNYIDEDLLNRWKKFLDAMHKKLDDSAYDEWFENLKDLEEIDYKYVSRYDLPNHRIIIKLK